MGILIPVHTCRIPFKLYLCSVSSVSAIPQLERFPSLQPHPERLTFQISGLVICSRVVVHIIVFSFSPLTLFKFPRCHVWEDGDYCRLLWSRSTSVALNSFFARNYLLSSYDRMRPTLSRCTVIYNPQTPCILLFCAPILFNSYLAFGQTAATRLHHQKIRYCPMCTFSYTHHTRVYRS